jgi:hypothetical protein
VNQAQFTVLHAHCETVMKVYLDAARTTCEMLGTCTPEPLSFVQRMALLRQEVLEKNAHVLYLEAKRHLHGAALFGYVATELPFISNGPSPCP